MKKLLLLLYMSIDLFAVESYDPAAMIDLNGTAKDMVYDNGRLVVATDMGHIEVYTVPEIKKIKEISIPNVKDFMGDMMPARIMSTDVIGEKYLLLSDSGIGGYANLFIHENNETIQVISPENKKPLIKARFVDQDHMLFGYLSNEVALYDLKTRKELYRKQLSESKFSDFAMNEDKSQVVFSCESGVLSVVDIKTGKIIKTLEGQNVDNVYKVDFKNGMVSGAGQDQRGSLYDVKTGKGSYIKGNFLIYATGLSPSASKVAFAMDERNNISIYDTSSKSKIALLKGQKSTLNVIIFKNENELFSASDDNTVMVWKLNKQ
ncbi:PQQ-binding-like beta-propeller repeat protein [Sulfurovum sp. ST-21]|uniref:PQQ-binding-like beta-propeller repeat protein n=1 Tax=Sulfurovum indicum TaxID=2779528 RepID=A0A7M1S4I2_9BACT|nr:PQQ-binding-like beta-propeller repeat protein [Sulfurovum indicum]QOR61639.1 PQQ-binding-like beta-propeller repeat protein [Sulfurovum indicum]